MHHTAFISPAQSIFVKVMLQIQCHGGYLVCLLLTSISTVWVKTCFFGLFQSPWAIVWTFSHFTPLCLKFCFTCQKYFARHSYQVLLIWHQSHCSGRPKCCTSYLMREQGGKLKNKFMTGVVFLTTNDVKVLQWQIKNKKKSNKTE